MKAEMQKDVAEALVAVGGVATGALWLVTDGQQVYAVDAVDYMRDLIWKVFGRSSTAGKSGKDVRLWLNKELELNVPEGATALQVAMAVCPLLKKRASS